MGAFERQLQFGKIGEGLVATWLREACKYNVLPVYEKELGEGKGPVFYAYRQGTLIAPDLFAFRGHLLAQDHIKWIEAKTKSAFSWYRNSGEWVTGIDLRHYKDYKKVAQLSPFPVWLLFLHLDGKAKDTPEGKTSPTGLFGGELLTLSKQEHHRSTNWGTSGMVYWADKTLTRFATLEQVMKYSRTAPEAEINNDPVAQYAVDELGAELDAPTPEQLALFAGTAGGHR